MKKMIPLLACVFISFSFAYGNGVDVLAEDFAKTRQEVEEAEVKQRQVLSALYQLNSRIKKSVTQRGELSQQRALLELNIAKLEKGIQELTVSTAKQRVMLAERLRAIYKLGGAPIARFIFSAQSSESLNRNLKIMGVVASRDLELIKNYQKDMKVVLEKKTKLSSQLSRLKSVETSITHQEASLRKEEALRRKLLEGIRRNKRFALNKINSLREKSLNYNLEDAGLFDLLFKPSFADQKGELPRPLSGEIIQKFGLMKGQVYPYTVAHKGIFIASNRGNEVKSIFGGKVSYVGQLPGYGQTLIIDHGDHYYSVYGNTEEVEVKLGDEVTQSQVIAKAGPAAIERNAGLYFEIRHFSEPYDPQQWMKGL